MNRFAFAAIAGALAMTPAAALAVDYRVAAEDERGLGLIDADSVTVVGENRRAELTVIFHAQAGDPPEVVVNRVLIDCSRYRYRMETVVVFDADLKEVARETPDPKWHDAAPDSPFIPVADFACRGKALERPEGADLLAIVTSYLRRIASKREI